MTMLYCLVINIEDKNRCGNSFDKFLIYKTIEPLVRVFASHNAKAGGRISVVTDPRR